MSGTRNSHFFRCVGKQAENPVTLLSPLSPSEIGCRPSVYRRSVTLTPSNTKIPVYVLNLYTFRPELTAWGGLRK